MNVLRLVLGDQLNLKISSLEGYNKKTDSVLMCEVMEEATRVLHHKKKLVFIFSAMRHFRIDLTDEEIDVSYIKLDDTKNTGSFYGEVKRFIEENKIDRLIITEPSEYKVFETMKKWSGALKVPVEFRPDTRFLCGKKEFVQWAENRKLFRMEHFYREMRKKYSLLIDNGKPEGGSWNYDALNREAVKGEVQVPQTYIERKTEITREVINLVSKKFPQHFGDIEPFYFSVTRKGALEALDKFIKERLLKFGQYQDAMVEGEPWLYHSHISMYLNSGLLLPLECIKRAEETYYSGFAPLNAVEGFIRQILGWREYVRGIYWLEMPDYENRNFLKAARKLPSLFWSGQTKMNCMRQCIKETKENAYAHHIQRLMVLGNFALLSGLTPNEVNDWYMVVYADAYQWVELPNVSGMVLFADGGLLASKPYVASGSYINKMSNYCKNCEYKVSIKTGQLACPFNYLYWNFLIQNEPILHSNHRLAMPYKTLSKMSSEKLDAIKISSDTFFESLSLDQKD